MGILRQELLYGWTHRSQDPRPDDNWRSGNNIIYNWMIEETFEKRYGLVSQLGRLSTWTMLAANPSTDTVCWWLFPNHQEERCWPRPHWYGNEPWWCKDPNRTIGQYVVTFRDKVQRAHNLNLQISPLCAATLLLEELSKELLNWAAPVEYAWPNWDIHKTMTAQDWKELCQDAIDRASRPPLRFSNASNKGIDYITNQSSYQGPDWLIDWLVMDWMFAWTMKSGAGEL
jgi:hypothetical protein